MESLIQDLRFGLRMMLRRPMFTIIAVLALALGIGATSAVFSVVNAIVLRPLPIKDQERMVLLWESSRETGNMEVEVSYANFVDWRKQNQVFEDMAALPSVNLDMTLTSGNEPEQISGTFVSASFFTMLGSQASLGRVFDSNDDKPNNRLVVISHGLWQRRFGGDANVLGRQMIVDSESLTIVGVMPAQFDFPRGVEMWSMMVYDPANPGWMQDRTFKVLRAIARLKPGVTLEQAQSGMETVASQLEKDYPKENKGFGVAIVPLTKIIFGNARLALLVMLGAVLLVLLIACANVANLLLARASERQREIAVRLALGASRGRLIRQLLTESLLLSLLGGGLGLVLAFLGVESLIKLAPADLPRVSEIGIDRQAVLFTGLISFLTSIIFGLAPALQSSRLTLHDTLKESAGKVAGSLRGLRLRNALVISEVALAVVLMIGAGLLIRSFQQYAQLDPGFNPNNILTMRVALNQSKYTGKEQYLKFFRELEQRVQQLPGKESAAAVLMRPLSGTVGWDAPFAIEGQNEAEFKQNPYSNFETIGPGYFRTMEIPLLRGRDFTEQDNEKSAGVVIINESMAKTYWPNQEAVGKRLKLNGLNPNAPWLEVVGVVKDVRYREWEKVRPDVYVPFPQRPQYRMDFVIRAQNPQGLLDSFRREVYAIDKEQAVSSITTMSQLVDEAIARQRFNMLILTIFAGLALLLAMVGVFGVMSYTVSQRTHEIGIRMALGAQRHDVIRLVVGQGVKLIASGIVIGLIAALGLTRIMSSLLYGVSASDPLTYLVIAVLLTLVAVLASYLPARRATKVDPIIALRYE